MVSEIEEGRTNVSAAGFGTVFDLQSFLKARYAMQSLPVRLYGVHQGELAAVLLQDDSLGTR